MKKEIVILAHDLGTSGNKASLYDDKGKLLATTYFPYQTYYPNPDWVEQGPRGLVERNMPIHKESNKGGRNLKYTNCGDVLQRSDDEPASCFQRGQNTDGPGDDLGGQQKCRRRKVCRGQDRVGKFLSHHRCRDGNT